MLWAEKNRVSRWALAVTCAGLLLTAELPWAIVLTVIRHLQLPDSQWSTEALIAVQVLPVPLILLVVSCFYLWLLIRRGSTSESQERSA